MTLTPPLNPILIQATDGSWLAIADPSSPVTVGAWESTKEQALDEFNAALTRLAGFALDGIGETCNKHLFALRRLFTTPVDTQAPPVSGL